jgi:transcriptional regulator with XRE-family HTH domain
LERLKNIIGPQVRKIRDSHGWTQEIFATKCNLVGLDLSRASLSKIEAGLRRVVDAEIPLLAKALKVPILELFPKT